MVKKRKKGSFWEAVSSFLVLSIIVIAIAWSFVGNNLITALAFIIIGLIVIIPLRFFKIKISEIYPDIIFGAIDNGILIFAAVLGAHFAGVAGAIIGGAAGNTITDGIGGIFEGHVAENQRKFKIDNNRTAISTSLGKMAGCLFGAGTGLLIVELIKLI